MKKLFLSFLAIILTLTLIGCIGSTPHTIDEIQSNLSIIYASGDDQNHVTQDVTLPTTSSLDAAATISWMSNNQAVISNSGVVTRSTTDVEVALIYSISYQGKASVGSFVVTVIADRLSLDAIKAAVTIGYSGDDDQNHVTQDVTLPTVSSLDSNATITWMSSNTNVISNQGVVTRPDSDMVVNLSYTITYYNQTTTGSMLVVVLEKDTYYTVSWFYNNGDAIDTLTVLENTVITEPTDPLRTGYTFGAWYTDPQLTAPYNFELPVTGDLSLYAKWNLIEISYTITFETNGGSTVNPVIGSNITPATPPNNPTKDGYLFMGWYRDEALTNSFSFSSTLSSDITLYAKWGTTTDYTGLYDGAEGLSGTALVDFLYTVVTSNITGNEQTYGDARYTLDDIDQDPANSNNVILVYLGTSVSGVWDGGNTWNREHVWPQSLLGVSAENSTVNRASDIHNLKPADPATNTSRSNKWFGPSTTSTSYEPRDEVKGDIARILFYMAVRYNDVLTLVNLSGSQIPSTYQMGDLATLLLWNLEDPVDAFEMARNDRIQNIQGNRNPFIDYPEFANLIWA